MLDAHPNTPQLPVRAFLSRREFPAGWLFFRLWRGRSWRYLGLQCGLFLTLAGVLELALAGGDVLRGHLDAPLLLDVGLQLGGGGVFAFVLQGQADGLGLGDAVIPLVSIGL